MSRDNRTSSQGMGASTADHIDVRGRNLTDLIGRLDFTSMIVLELLGREPNERERRLVDAVLVTVTEHGMTPSSISARLTHLGSPESLQGAVAAGLIGAGNRYLGAMEGCARFLQSLVASRSEQGDIESAVRTLIDQGDHIPGIGHPIHVQGDPRTPALFRLADELGYPDDHRSMLKRVRHTASAIKETELPINAGGAVGAILSDAGMHPKIARGLAVIGRAAGLVGHVLEEDERPVGPDIWRLVDNAVAYSPPGTAVEHESQDDESQ